MLGCNTHKSIAREIWPLGGEKQGASYPLPSQFRASPELYFWPHHLLVGIFEDNTSDDTPELLASSGTDSEVSDSASICTTTDSEVQENRQALATRVALATGSIEELQRPCVDCGLITGCYCDYCLAIDRSPTEHWVPKQRTPLCTACDSRCNACRFCRKVPSCTPFPWGQTTI